jgi:hypothetical protein
LVPGPPNASFGQNCGRPRGRSIAGLAAEPLGDRLGCNLPGTCESPGRFRVADGNPRADDAQRSGHGG